MDMKLKAALERVGELEDELLDQQVVIDLLHEDINDRDEMIQALKGELLNRKIDVTYPDLSVAL